MTVPRPSYSTGLAGEVLEPRIPPLRKPAPPPPGCVLLLPAVALRAEEAAAAVLRPINRSTTVSEVGSSERLTDNELLGLVFAVDVLSPVCWLYR